MTLYAVPHPFSLTISNRVPAQAHVWPDWPCVSSDCTKLTHASGLVNLILFILQVSVFKSIVLQEADLDHDLQGSPPLPGKPVTFALVFLCHSDHYLKLFSLYFCFLFSVFFPRKHTSQESRDSVSIYHCYF